MLHSHSSIAPTLATVFVLFIGTSTPAQMIYENNFDDDPVGIYTEDNLDADWNTPVFSNGVEVGEQRVSIVDGNNAFEGRSLAVLYPEGEHSPRETGAQWQLDFEGHEDVTVEYRVKFGDGFDFVRGGKLPGLAGGEANTGGNIPDGTDGFSARMHWRTDGSSGSDLTPDMANITQYMYHPDADNGDDFNWDDGPSGQWERFESGRWYHFKHRVKMNTPGQNGQPGLNDGIVQAWLDGEMVLDRTDVRYRDVDSLKIDVFYFSTFFGGSGSRWDTTADETIFFDDFKIYVTDNEPVVVNECPDQIAIVGDELIIRGTQGPDDMIVSQIDGALTVDYNQTCAAQFPSSSISRIVISGFGGADFIRTDVTIPTLIAGGFGADEIYGGEGANAIHGGPGGDMIWGGPENDFINAGRGIDTVYALQGDDDIIGGDADDLLMGGSGDDFLMGGLGGDTLLGDAGSDFLVGNVGADTLDGGPGNDELTGLGGPDSLSGGSGNDTIRGGEGFDTINGGDGFDTALDNGEIEISIEN